MWPSLPCDMRDRPRAGTEPVATELPSRFLTTGPPGKSILKNVFGCAGS